MPSRMEKYYQTEVEVSKRTKRNQHIYDEIHNSLDYSNIKQGLNVNEINSKELNEILKNEKKPQNSRISKVEISNYNNSYNEVEVEEKNYDIKEVLDKAKNENTSINYDYHKLKDDQINLLKKIESYRASKQEQDESLDDLLNTIANTKLLQQLNDQELSLNMFNDLKSNNENTVVGGIDSINKVMNESPKIIKDEDEKNEIDKSFYTSSMNFTEEDFDELNEIKKNIKKNNNMIRWLFIALAIALVIAIILIILVLK